MSKSKESDVDYHRRKAREYYHKKMKEDPEWNARRQRDYRKRKPEKFNMCMARFYFKKLPMELKTKLINEFNEFEGVKK